ncbi:MAG: hypothetical protein ACFFKA_02490 [Candidatus Thorarchaeota archaeon]
MYLFEGKSEKEIITKCKLCLSEVKFIVSLDEYKSNKDFPFKKESLHGIPPHKLIISLNRNLEIENFKIEDVLDKDVSFSKELTYQVLSDIQLSEDEIQLYFLTTGRDVVSLGEMALLIDKTKEECKIVAEKFVDKGLYKEIVGATPHYAPLPPYAALIKQLVNFEEYIRGIKNEAPNQLNQSFTQLEAKAQGIQDLNEYTNFIKNLKGKIEEQMALRKKDVDNAIQIIGQIKKINDIIFNLENDTKIIVEEQVKDIEKQFEEMKEMIVNNLQKLHLGVISKTVHQIIDNVLNTRMQIIIEGFNEKLLLKIRNIIKTIVENVNEVAGSSMRTGEDLETTFASVIEVFSESVTIAEEKVKGISEAILLSFQELRNIFSTKVVDTLNRELSKILERLSTSKITTQEFWDQAKKKSLMTMRDIWFIKSLEGANAHINEEILKAKMRILIVAPNITDINVSLLESLPKHTNIRIVAYIDPDLPEHVQIIERLDVMQNVSYRHRELQDLYGINRDYEEVILCILSETEIGQRRALEIGGIGSIIPEHIKIFVPVLEEAWIGAQKTVMPSLRTGYVPKVSPSLPTSNVQYPSPSMELKPSISDNNNYKPSPNHSLFKSSNSLNNDIKTADLEQKSLNQSIIAQPARTEGETSQRTFISEKNPQSMTLREHFDYIILNINTKAGVALSSDLQNFKNRIEEEVGYTSLINPINITISELSQISGILSTVEKQSLLNKMNFWKSKLNL